MCPTYPNQSPCMATKRAHKWRGPSKAVFIQEDKRSGLSVTAELQKAISECTERVKTIVNDCRSKNRKFRDDEFDLEVDKFRCLYGANIPTTKTYYQPPPDVHRVTQLFDKPSFFVDGAKSDDIQQGDLGDCWLLSALATLTSNEKLIDKFCVHRDEEVGVYGFIFFRDSKWVPVIIDDLLFTSIPKFEELNPFNKSLYHGDKEIYNKYARRNGKSLLFARSGTEGETWVPLVEKAFAKLHGSYSALPSGLHGEGTEDLTGGVSTFISVKDILDKDKFWKEELSANHGRLFGCSFGKLDGSRNGDWDAKVSGLVGGHAYSILRTAEYNGKRFVVLRNPWGNSEWTGKWADGSKEWTSEWLPALEEIGHTFGDDGQFVMEYDDFLENWEDIERVRLFDDSESWVMSSQWLDVTVRPIEWAWRYGDVSFTIDVPVDTPSIIVLSQLDRRYYQPLENEISCLFDFVVYKKGGKTPTCYSTRGRFSQRSVNAEVELKAGSYVVHVRIDRALNIPDPIPKVNPDTSPVPDSYCQCSRAQPRYMSRALTEQAKSHAISLNSNKDDEGPHIPIPLSVIAGQDLSELKAKARAADEALHTEMEALGMPDGGSRLQEGGLENQEVQSWTTNPGADNNLNNNYINKESLYDGIPADNEAGDQDRDGWDKEEMDTDEDEGVQDRSEESSDWMVSSDSSGDRNRFELGPSTTPKTIHSLAGDIPRHVVHTEVEYDSVTLGLRVYTSKNAPTRICGQLRHEMNFTFDALAIEAFT